MAILGKSMRASKNGLIQSIRKWNRKRRAQRANFSTKPKQKNSLCVLGIFKNEELGIEEWIEHYLWQGADKIILIDNGSTDSSTDRIARWASDDRVSCIRLPQPHRQREHYWTAIKEFQIQQKWTWLLISDLDEYWFSKDGDPLRKKLKEYEDVDVVYCNWSIFGCPDVAPHPESLRSELLYRDPILGRHKHRKYFVRARKLTKSSMIDVHCVKGLDSARSISDNINIQINHYVTQSCQFWTLVKMKRGDAVDPLNDNVRGLEIFREVNSSSTHKDHRLAEFVKQNVK